MSGLLRGRSAFCRIIPFIRQSNVKLVLQNRISYLVNLKSATVLSQSRSYATEFQNSEASSAPLEARTNQPPRRPLSVSLKRNIDEALDQIDREVRRVGRTRKDAVMTTYRSLQKLGHVTEHQSLLLLRCMGSFMVDETAAVRTELAEQIWAGLKDMGLTFGVKHYNALLGVYLQNEHKFSPSEFLGKMEAEGIAPIRLTFQRLIAGYCQSGDIEGASQVLEHMKTANQPINESVFNSLIMGHMRAGDEESARGILKIMNESGIPPSGDTYSTLMVELAKKGDIESIEKLSADAQESEVAAYPSHYFDVVQSLSSSGHYQHIDKVLDLCPKANTAWYNQDCMNAVLQMVAQGKDDIAHKLFLSMQHFRAVDETQSSFGNFFLKALVKHERPLEKVTSIYNDLLSRELCSCSLDFIAQWALVYEKPDYALEAFDLLLKEGIPLRTHFFWPVFISYRKQKNAEGIYQAVTMMERKVERSHDFLHTLYDFIVPCLLKSGEKFEDLSGRLKETGIAAGDINLAWLLDLMRKGKNDEMLKFAKEEEVTFYHALLRQPLLSLFKNTEDPNIVLELLELAQNNGRALKNYKVTDLATSFLFYAMDKYGEDSDRIEQFVQGLIDKKIGVNNSENLTEKLTAVGVSLKLIEELVAIEVSSASRLMQPARTPFEPTLYGSKSIEELERILSDNRASNSSIKGPLKWLCEKYCQIGNIARVEEIKTELDGLGFIYTPDVIRGLMFLAARHKKDLAEAMKYKEMLESQFDDFHSYTSEIFDIANLYASEGNIEGVLSTLRDFHAKSQKYMKDKGCGDGYINEDECIRLIEKCQAAGLMEAPVEIMNTLFECGFIKTGCHSLLVAYVKGYLDKDDISGAVEAMSYCNKQYRRTPKVGEIFRALIQKENPEKLQQVLDIASTSLGEMQALHYLMFSFIECGKESQARRILETPGMRAMMEVFDFYCNQLISRRKVEELESLVQITKGLFGLDREHVYFMLMKAYCTENEMDKALNILSILEEENLNPRARTLRYLGKALTTKGMEVPFEIPGIPVSEQPERPIFDQPKQISSLSVREMQVIQQISSGDTSPLQDVKALKELIGGSFSSDFLIQVVRSLSKKNKNKVGKLLVQDLAAMGETEALENIHHANISFFSDVAPKVLSKTYLERGEPEKLVDVMAASEKNVDKYLNTPVCDTLYEKYPTLFEKVEGMILSAGDGGNMQALNILWQHYFNKEQLDKASELLQRYPDLHKTLRIVQACADAKENNREDLLQYLIDVPGKDSASNRAFAYSYLIGLKGQQNDWQGALNVLDKVKEVGLSRDDLRPFPLAALESLLLDNNQTVPWEVGKYGKVNKAEDSSSSSSSSSDSDSESSAEPSIAR